MYHPYLSEQLSGEKETEFQHRADQARGIRKAGHRLSAIVAVLLVLGMLVAACGGGTVAVEDDAAARQTIHAADRQAMLDRAIADLIRINGPYFAQQQGPAGSGSTLPSWFIVANGPYSEADTANVPANRCVRQTSWN